MPVPLPAGGVTTSEVAASFGDASAPLPVPVPLVPASPLVEPLEREPLVAHVVEGRSSIHPSACVGRYPRLPSQISA
jgi:hypothetical protein